MPLPPYNPKPGELLICDFDAGGFMPPEMVKKRPVVVVSRAETHGRRLCTVVPLSTTAPMPVHLWHHPMPHLKIIGLAPSGTIWAKCDMLATVCFDRLNKPHTKTRHGRLYHSIRLSDPDLDAIKAGMRSYLLL